MEIPTVGYMGHKPTYRPATTTVNHRKDPFFNINPLKPRLKETNLNGHEEFARMTDGFKAAVTSNQKSVLEGKDDNS